MSAAGRRRSGKGAGKARRRKIEKVIHPADAKVGTVVLVTHWDSFGTVEESEHGRFYVSPKDRHLLDKLNAVGDDCMSAGSDPLVAVCRQKHTAKYVFNAEALEARTRGMEDVAPLVDKLLRPKVEGALLAGANDGSDYIQVVTYDEHSCFSL